MTRELPAELTSRVQLLVEGSEPKNVFRRFCMSWGLQEIQIHDFGGVTELRGFLRAFKVISGFHDVTNLGIIRDAERSAQSARQSVQNSLRGAALDSTGTSHGASPGQPAVSVLILPDGRSPGSLESVLWRSIEGDPKARCIEDYLACIELDSRTVARGDKARVHSWLAGMPQPTGSIGVAARKGYWDPTHTAFSEVRRFLTELNAG